MAAPKGVCCWCREPVEATEKAAYEITGYERERQAGGANTIAGRKRVDRRIWHDRFQGDHFDLHLAGHEQPPLFAEMRKP